MWNLPQSFTGKRIWIGEHFEVIGRKRLILTHRKNLLIGDFLVDDRLKYGAAEFREEHIHFGTEKFPDWEITSEYLILRSWKSYKPEKQKNQVSRNKAFEVIS